jgi:hypothetical protein
VPRWSVRRRKSHKKLLYLSSSHNHEACHLPFPRETGWDFVLNQLWARSSERIHVMHLSDQLSVASTRLNRPKNDTRYCTIEIGLNSQVIRRFESPIVHTGESEKIISPRVKRFRADWKEIWQRVKIDDHFHCWKSHRLEIVEWSGPARSRVKSSDSTRNWAVIVHSFPE